MEVRPQDRGAEAEKSRSHREASDRAGTIPEVSSSPDGGCSPSCEVSVCDVLLSPLLSWFFL